MSTHILGIFQPASHFQLKTFFNCANSPNYLRWYLTLSPPTMIKLNKTILITQILILLLAKIKNKIWYQGIIYWSGYNRGKSESTWG